MPNLSVVIPSWDGLNLLKVCLSSLTKQTYKDFEIIVVDNGSLDGTGDFLNQKYPTVKVIQLDRNYGYAKAANLGIKSSSGAYILLLNNDTKVDKNCLSYLVKAAGGHQECGMVAAKMLSLTNPKIIYGAGGYIDAVGHANTIGWGKLDGVEFNQAKKVFLVSGGGGLFKRKLFDEVGLFDEDFFAYFEDVDLCFRAQLRGFTAWYEPKAIIYHIHKATSGRNRGFTEYLQFRNMTQMIIKNFPKELLMEDYNWLKIILVNVNTIRYLFTKGFFTEAIKAEFYILMHLSLLLKKRRYIQATLRVSTQYIIDNIIPKKVTLFGLLQKGF